MNIVTKFIDISTKGNNDIIDITYQVSEKLRETKLDKGQVLLFIPGSTAGLTTMEYEPGQIQDLKDMIEELVPHGKNYAHNHSMAGSDDNAHSHLRSSLVKTELTIPFANMELLLGTWQQIVFIDFDIYPRDRKIILQFIGE